MLFKDCTTRLLWAVALKGNSKNIIRFRNVDIDLPFVVSLRCNEIALDTGSNSMHGALIYACHYFVIFSSFSSA